MTNLFLGSESKEEQEKEREIEKKKEAENRCAEHLVGQIVVPCAGGPAYRGLSLSLSFYYYLLEVSLSLPFSSYFFFFEVDSIDFPRGFEDEEVCGTCLPRFVFCEFGFVLLYILFFLTQQHTGKFGNLFYITKIVILIWSNQFFLLLLLLCSIFCLFINFFFYRCQDGKNGRQTNQIEKNISISRFVKHPFFSPQLSLMNILFVNRVANS